MVASILFVWLALLPVVVSVVGFKACTNSAELECPDEIVLFQSSMRLARVGFPLSYNPARTKLQFFLFQNIPIYIYTPSRPNTPTPHPNPCPRFPPVEWVVRWVGGVGYLVCLVCICMYICVFGVFGKTTKRKDAKQQTRNWS